ncbi:uncharacterized protein V1510DRAFT_417547 [Dipodascopsis tothii]|uniref:uncharacterized protein n=1 Tax=Dipodascopsis tothii TaxID=44089 RepID=UPI0034CDB1BB
MSAARTTWRVARTSRWTQIARFYGSAAARPVLVPVDGAPTAFDPIFLRDACACDKCVDPSSKQKRRTTAQTPPDVRAEAVRAAPDGTVLVDFASGVDGAHRHTGVYPADFLRTYSSPRARFDHRWGFPVPEVYWEQATLGQHLVDVDFDAYMADDGVLRQFLLGLYSTGLAFVSNVPAQERLADGQIAVEAIGRRIGYIKNTFYGPSWNVISQPGAKNIAYTSENLGLHMDLLYYESPPGVQLLHCIANNADGGESVYADAFRAAYVLAERDRAAFDLLASFPITFHYKNDGQHYAFTRPLFEVDPANGPAETGRPVPRLRSVNYSPPFQAPFDHLGTEFAAFRAAFAAFEAVIASPAQQYETRFAPGQCAVFFNRRVLHSRREFRLRPAPSPAPADSRAAGRWLKGTYLDIDSFYSKLRVLCGM